MTQSAQQVPLHHADYVSLHFRWFAFWWLLIFCIDFTTFIYNVAYAKFYWIFSDTYLRYTLESYGVGMPHENFRTIAYVYGVMASMHGICALSMIIGSWRQRTLAFSISVRGKKSVSPTTSIDKTTTNSRSNTFATAVYQKTIHRRGIFGVNGKYFNVFRLCREIVEIGLQTVQAFRMSKFLPRTMLNRFYVCLVAANCWSSALTNSNWFWKNEAHRRFAAIAGDCAISLISTIGVPILVASSYVIEYDTVLKGFGFKLLQDDEWVAQMLNEAQVVLVVSWADLASRFIFSLGILTSTINMKELLYYVPRSNRVTHGGSEANNLDYLSSAPYYSYATKPKTAPIPSQQNKMCTYKHLHNVLLYGVQFFLAVWGVVIMILHMHASSIPPLVECMPRVQPFAGILPSCLVLNFNCHKLNIAGKRKVVQAEWEKFESDTVTKLQFLHCSALEVPKRFQTFRRLAEIKVYNTTILEWGADAAITNTHHPAVSIMSIVRVNMTAGLLPLGFQSLDFPLNLKQLYFCETNLQKLPDDLDTKWPIGSTISIENSMLTDVPPVITRLQPQYLVLSKNMMQNFSPELFETESMQFILINRNTHVTQLPENVTKPIAGPVVIDISNTKISFFWSWIDQLIENMVKIKNPPPIFAGGSPYCLERDDIMNGLAENFSKPFEAGHSALLMNASMTNWGRLLAAVDCSPELLIPNFPLVTWDQMYAMTDVPNG